MRRASAGRLDADAALVHTAVGTAANVKDLNVAGQLLHGEEEPAVGDAGLPGSAQTSGPAERHCSLRVMMDTRVRERRGAPESRSRRLPCSRDEAVRRTAKGQPPSGGDAGHPAQPRLTGASTATGTDRRSAIGVHPSKNGQSLPSAFRQQVAALRTRPMRPPSVGWPERLG